MSAASSPVTAPLTIGGVTLQSRFFLGTAGYPSPAVLARAIERSASASCRGQHR